MEKWKEWIYGFEYRYSINSFSGGRSQLGCCVAKSGKIHTTDYQTHKKMTPPQSRYGVIDMYLG